MTLTENRRKCCLSWTLAEIAVFQFAVAFFATRAAFGDARIQAYRGEPFGIGRVTIDLPAGSSSAPASDDRFALTEENDRVLYPVIENKASRRILRGLLGIDGPMKVTYFFMFRGDAPLNVVAYSPTPEVVSIRPSDNPKEFNRLLGDWWNANQDHYQQVFRSAEYPIVVDNFLTATWARRLNQQMPMPRRQLSQKIGAMPPWLSQLLANEDYQTEIERDMLLGRLSSGEAATIPLPDATLDKYASKTSAGPGNNGTVKKEATLNELPTPGVAIEGIEPLASHVPHECFYMRFGNFTNYLWYRDFMRHWQGDLGNMLVNQSVNHNNSERVQQQIAVGETKIARVMGPTVVRDVAFIGLDPYMRDGAAMGILFQANNSVLLNRNLSGQRLDAKAQHKDAIEETVRIGNHDVSYIHTPDGRLRSYYAIDGDFHLVASCRRLIERFYEAAAGNNSLAASAEFADCRAAMPLTRDDTLFLFAPAAFFQNLASPHYRVELDRRLRSIGEMRSLTLAQLAARAEGRDAKTVDQLVAAELLPSGFARRTDGSKLVEVPASAVEKATPQNDSRGAKNAHLSSALRDSLRGDPGWMTPIPDVSVDRITPTESRRLAELQRGLRNDAGNFAPVCLALKRMDSPAQKGWDRIVADVRVAPFSQMPIAKWPNMLGPAATSRVSPIEGDVVSLEIILDALGEPMHLFGGLRDFRTPLIVRQGEVTTDQSISEYIRGYIGGWPRPHLIDRFVRIPDGPLDADNMARTRGLFSLWFRRADDFFLFSFKRDVLLQVGSQLAMLEAKRPAQIRLFIDDLSNKQLATAVSGIGYMRARDTSASASRFMNSLTTQLHVEPEQAKTLGESLVNGHFECPLGGKYVLVEPPTDNVNPDAQRSAPIAESLPAPADAGNTFSRLGRKLWASTAPTPANRFLLTEVPADYQLPLMSWFRGLSAEAGRYNDELSLHAALEMTHIDVGPPEDPNNGSGGVSLPSFSNLFGGLGLKKDENVKPAAATEQSATSNK